MAAGSRSRRSPNNPRHPILVLDPLVSAEKAEADAPQPSPNAGGVGRPASKVVVSKQNDAAIKPRAEFEDGLRDAVLRAFAGKISLLWGDQDKSEKSLTRLVGHMQKGDISFSAADKGKISIRIKADALPDALKSRLTEANPRALVVTTDRTTLGQVLSGATEQMVANVGDANKMRQKTGGDGEASLTYITRKALKTLLIPAGLADKNKELGYHFTLTPQVQDRLHYMRSSDQRAAAEAQLARFKAVSFVADIISGKNPTYAAVVAGTKKTKESPSPPAPVRTHSAGVQSVLDAIAGKHTYAEVARDSKKPRQPHQR